MHAFKLKAAVSAMALLAAAPALADVTAQQVWDDWKAQMGVYGESAVTIGSETYENGVLTVTDLGFDVTGEDGSTATGNLPQLVFTENGDGTVGVTMSEEYPITISTPADASTGSEASDVALALRQNGLQMKVSGNPGALTYDVSAARYAIELDSVKEAGTEVPAEALLAFNDLSGTYTSTTGAMRDVTYDLAAASMDLLLDATNPEDGSHVMLSGKVNQVATQATVTMPLDPAADPEMMVMNGLAMQGGYTTAGGQYIFEFTDASGPTNGTFSTAGSALNFQFSKDSLAYDSSATGVALQATSAAMPIPLDATIGEYGVKFQMPLSKTGAPAPWAAGLTLRDLALNDEVWQMFDPQGVLPHDPATVAVDLSGTATMLFDAMDPAQAEAMASAPMPAQLNSVDINEFNVTFGGASVTGTGSFTLDNNDLTTFPGMPKPTGSVDLQLNGVKALISNLATMGLLPQDQVMIGLGMLGAFATEVGPDQLTSHIEATQDGQLLVNGNPMPMQ
ncbi:hypothetical protein Rumeso_03739 [Rubellimicrobium mesophilum DSM 19309]|uniref:DUF2125 domain-containing protein n=1 Tax=Rubellimicrobium mesophilum DSM 19309 TaxID=442562 RepID=A0A017HJL0_9RHOB|nr:DUF2125 domain-containing protein [Rubellimicrobium mesophilum]EYD74682.1 hypothetical protein Rumeso_03739 [Rubellimicrobium mesophilum DSM 19309]